MSQDLVENFIQHMGFVNRLDHMPRSGYALTGVPNPESVASHLFSVSYIAMLLGRQLIADGEPLELEVVLQMALLHESGEPFIGDIVPDGKRAFGEQVKIEAEKKAGSQNLELVNSELRQLFVAFLEGKSPEAKLVRDCDLLQFIFKSATYLRNGFRGVTPFVVKERCEFHFKLCEQIAERVVLWAHENDFVE